MSELVQDDWLTACNGWGVSQRAKAAGLSTRAWRTLIWLLQKAEPTREDAASISDNAIMRHPNAGKKTLKDIRQWQQSATPDHLSAVLDELHGPLQ